MQNGQTEPKGYPKAYKGTRCGAVKIFDFANNTHAKISCKASHIVTQLSS